MFITRYFKGRPANLSPDTDVFVCESRYNEEKHSFNKIKTWASCLPDEVRDKDYAMEPFAVPRKYKKFPSPIAYLLKDEQKETDDLPKAEWGADNAPPKVGGVHRRPRDPRVYSRIEKATRERYTDAGLIGFASTRTHTSASTNTSSSSSPEASRSATSAQVFGCCTINHVAKHDSTFTIPAATCAAQFVYVIAKSTRPHSRHARALGKHRRPTVLLTITTFHTVYAVWQFSSSIHIIPAPVVLSSDPGCWKLPTADSRGYSREPVSARGCIEHKLPRPAPNRDVHPRRSC